MTVEAGKVLAAAFLDQHQFAKAAPKPKRWLTDEYGPIGKIRVFRAYETESGSGFAGSPLTEVSPTGSFGLSALYSDTGINVLYHGSWNGPGSTFVHEARTEFLVITRTGEIAGGTIRFSYTATCAAQRGGREEADFSDPQSWGTSDKQPEDEDWFTNAHQLWSATGGYPKLPNPGAGFRELDIGGARTVVFVCSARGIGSDFLIDFSSGIWATEDAPEIPDGDYAYSGTTQSTLSLSGLEFPAPPEP